MTKPIRVGRYLLFSEIASGGMATVHYGHVRGDASFARIVAIKRLHPHLAKDDEFNVMFLDEARIAARIRHPNAVNILDVVSLPAAEGGELLIVMEYIAGESLSRLLRRLRDDHDVAPTDITCAIICDALQGLHAAHEAKSDQGDPLGIIHRDVSPHNLLVGADGITRLVDFGVAKARGRIHATREGQVKGKIAYMPPEQLRGKAIDRRCDIYAMGVVLWETLTCARLFHADSEGEVVTKVLEHKVMPPSQIIASSPKALDAVVLKALSRDPQQRYATARDMAAAIEAAAPIASARKVASFVETVAGDVLAERQRAVSELERRSEEEDSAIGTPQGVEAPVPSSSSRRRRIGLLAVAMVLVGGVAVGAAKLRTQRATGVIAPVSSPSIPATTSTASTPSNVPSNMSSAPSPVVVTSAGTAAPPRIRTATRTPAPVASSDKPCPVKTFVDSDGIVQFRRECPP